MEVVSDGATAVELITAGLQRSAGADTGSDADHVRQPHRQGRRPRPDDYLTGPFAFDEFLARVHTLLWGIIGEQPALRLADLTLDPAARAVTRGERRIGLTAREYALIEYFMRNPAGVLTRPLTPRHAWGIGFDSESNIIDVSVGYVPRNIDGDGGPHLLHTVRGAGYTLGAD